MASSKGRGRYAAWGLIGAVGSLVVPLTATAAPGPPPPKGTNGHKPLLVASGIPTPSQIAFGHSRIFVATPGDEQSGKGGGVYQIWRGKVSQIAKSPFIGLVYTHGTLFGSSQNKVIAWSGWRNGAFTKRKVIFKRPLARLPFLETMAVGHDGRLYMGSSDAGDKGPIGTPLSGRVFAMKRDGSGLEELARGLRQPFGIAFFAGDRYPYNGNESDESTPTPRDFFVHSVKGSDFGFTAGCQWVDPAAAACAGKTAPILFLPPHASPTGMVGKGHRIYVAFFGGTTKKGPEVRVYTPTGTSKRIVQSPVPLVGVGLSGRGLYFATVTGSIYRIKV